MSGVVETRGRAECRTARRRIRDGRMRSPLLTVGCIVLGAVAGCGTVGSLDIANARAAYNEVIRRTDDEQLLRMIVQTRYGESHSALVVSSVTSNLTFTSTLGAQFGVGSASNYAGNLVPLSAGVAYAENPTISYVPRQGEQYIEDLLSPIGLEVVALLFGAVDHPGWLLSLCVEQINGVRSGTKGSAHDARVWARAVEIIDELNRTCSIAIARHSDGTTFVLGIHDYSPAHQEAIRELLQGFRLDPVTVDGGPVVIPMRLAFKTRRTDILDIVTRSPYDLLRLASAGVEVPAADLAAGVTDPSITATARDAAREVGVGAVPEHPSLIVPLRIQSSSTRPRHSVVAVEHRGTWFSIDETDWASKQGFLLLRVLVLGRIQNDSGSTRPVLTLPVG